MKRWLPALLVALCALPAMAEVPLQLSGALVEGGLIFGQTAPGATVTLDKDPVAVSADGHFLLGFGRDAAGVKHLQISVHGGRLARELAVADRDFKIERIEGLPGRKVTPDPKDLQRIQQESALMADAKKTDDPELGYLSGFVWPAKGRISGVYGSQRVLNGEPRRPHYGTDIAAPIGTEVRAFAAGRVAFVHPGMFFNGKTVLIDHGLGLRSVYIHMSEARVQADMRVRAGDVIGAIGATGRATGPHLHFGLTLGTTPIDAEVLLGPLGD